MKTLTAAVALAFFALSGSAFAAATKPAAKKEKKGGC